jgi:hypothetical protein
MLGHYAGAELAVKGNENRNADYLLAYMKTPVSNKTDLRLKAD